MDIYSLGDLSIDCDGLGTRARSILNSSGSLQSAGNMRLAASTIDNVREVLTTHDAGIYTASITWSQFTNEQQAMLSAASSKTQSQKESEIWDATRSTALGGLGKGVVNYPSDALNGIIDFGKQLFHVDGVGNEVVGVPLDYSNEVERDIAKGTQHLIDNAMTTLGAAWASVRSGKSVATIEGESAPSFPNQFPDHPTGVPTLISDTKLTQGAEKYNYVVLKDGQLVIGRKFNGVGGGHIDLANGKSVIAAGEVKILSGKVKYIDNTSGHYEPSGRLPRQQQKMRSLKKDLM